MSASLTARRAWALVLAAVVAAAVAALAFSGTRAVDRAEGADHAHAAATARTAKAQSLHDGMRALWEDHIVWTRMAIVSFAADLPDLSAASARLLRNQEDIGDAIAPYYGRRAGNQLTALLKEHITGAVELLAAAKAGDATRLAAARAAWYDNGDRIAEFLSKANPRHWKARRMRALMRGHLDDTLDEALARLEGRHTADIRAYDRIHRHILMMADVLSDGIVKQFPRRFR